MLSIFKEVEVRVVCWRKCKIGDCCCEREDMLMEELHQAVTLTLPLVYIMTILTHQKVPACADIIHSNQTWRLFIFRFVKIFGGEIFNNKKRAH